MKIPLARLHFYGYNDSVAQTKTITIGGKFMGMEFWLIPVLAMIIAGVTIFYMVIRHQGGSGSRGEGHTVVDKPAEQTPQAGWNYYK